MSGLGTAALVAAGIWVGVLSLVVVLLVRQVGIITLRLDRAREEDAPVTEGIDVGEPLPQDVAAALPTLNGRPTYVLLLGGLCPPCQELAFKLRDDQGTQSIVAVISGRNASADAIAEAMSERAAVVREPDATAIADGFGVGTTPFAFEISDHEITGKAVVRGADHFASFMRDEGLVPGVVRISNGKTEANADG